ncbi:MULTISPECIES: SIS domain-containing protein [unclassified Enterococcus]|uniref:SIS domain-containing protein n=1 Tax=unclassified Enterococcus TaxID=2608891 RepID=UPI001A9148B3|nr:MULTISPECIES: SIS domain-containing protein [unclassified Enterococcus]MBO0460294.1 SIS domain-containing protein [Enterococcus sp. DIV1298c]MBO1298392.1 SIS domain-containing protein [Enterococcus sp. DIV1271a]
MSLPYFDYCQQLEQKLRIEEPLMEQAGRWIATQIRRGGCLHIFASRTLQGVAYEFWQQCPKILPSQLIEHPAAGIYETLEGTGHAIIEQINTHPEDIFLLLSNEGRNPAIIELAEWIKAQGHLLIVITGFDLSRSIKSRHSSGLRLYEYADLVLDNYATLGDAVLTLPKFELAICGTASLATQVLLQQIVYFAVLHLFESH